jgi:hypothetical protein
MSCINHMNHQQTDVLRHSWEGMEEHLGPISAAHGPPVVHSALLHTCARDVCSVQSQVG